MSHGPAPSWIIFDFDGVFTDNRVLVGEDGTEYVFCNRADGLGVKMLRKAGMEMMVITTETNPVVQQRCRKLNLPVLVEPEDKAARLQQWSRESGVSLRDVAYVGNDLNDLEAIQLCGTSFAPSDADVVILKIVTHVLPCKGGAGISKEIYRHYFPTLDAQPGK